MEEKEIIKFLLEKYLQQNSNVSECRRCGCIYLSRFIKIDSYVVEEINGNMIFRTDMVTPCCNKNRVIDLSLKMEE